MASYGSTATLSNVSASASSVQLLAGTTGEAVCVFNDSSADLYLKYGTAASTSSFTVKIPPGGFYEFPTRPLYRGVVHGIWSAASGSARITEVA